ncbi:hypothetical protein CAPTEDRAFT_216148 [Capitella teleta]|uniref:F5/8 type C domain-containing protein n=1 Tax=Capitella teleta TaxID=283909 RepID=R7UP00_CAPTE|nr:hypothetical protein CAPTEDRAFT_216148 [Capitella teleta]|eukprot:ELU05096.1 hypothetical protein CAPTEDRAFT_216148 [Capitella teleta]
MKRIITFYLLLSQEILAVIGHHREECVTFEKSKHDNVDVNKQSKICSTRFILITGFALREFVKHPIWRSRIVSFSASCQCIGYEPLIINAEKSQLTTSSAFNAGHVASESKYNETGWCQRRPYEPLTSHIEIDLMENRNLGGIVTWGRGDNHGDQFVKSFTLKYRIDASNTWTDYTDSDGNTTLVGNDNKYDPVLNNFQGNILARYVRLHPIGYHHGPVIRWEILGCAKYLLPCSPHDFEPGTAAYGIASKDCIRTRNNRIRLQYTGLTTHLNAINLALSGHSLICKNYYTTLGIEMKSVGCKVDYKMCRVKEVDGKCQVSCNLEQSQVGQPFNIRLMITGDDSTELCSVESDMSHAMWPSGRSVIDDWDAFIQKIAATT